eukprot:365123-Chlamydomonas_euryale.AAC.19
MRLKLGRRLTHVHCLERREATDALRDNIQALSDRQEEQHKLNEVIVVKLARQVDYLQTFVKEDSSL